MSVDDEARSIFWERQAKVAELNCDYYQKALEEAHAMIGRLIMQMSARWDTAKLTKHWPHFGTKPAQWVPVSFEEHEKAKKKDSTP